MWRSGKRSGFGSYRFSNGDMFRGTWRDDIMHGKVLEVLISSGLLIQLTNEFIVVTAFSLLYVHG